MIIQEDHIFLINEILIPDHSPEDSFYTNWFLVIGIFENIFKIFLTKKCYFHFFYTFYSAWQSLPEFSPL